jgi:hypothetical protein
MYLHILHVDNQLIKSGQKPASTICAAKLLGWELLAFLLLQASLLLFTGFPI